MSHELFEFEKSGCLKIFYRALDLACIFVLIPLGIYILYIYISKTDTNNIDVIDVKTEESENPLIQFNQLISFPDANPKAIKTLSKKVVGPYILKIIELFDDNNKLTEKDIAIKLELAGYFFGYNYINNHVMPYLKSYAQLYGSDVPDDVQEWENNIVQESKDNINLIKTDYDSYLKKNVIYRKYNQNILTIVSDGCVEDYPNCIKYNEQTNELIPSTNYHQGFLENVVIKLKVKKYQNKEYVYPILYKNFWYCSKNAAKNDVWRKSIKTLIESMPEFSHVKYEQDDQIYYINHKNNQYTLTVKPVDVQKNMCVIELQKSR